MKHCSPNCKHTMNFITWHFQRIEKVASNSANLVTVTTDSTFWKIANEAFWSWKCACCTGLLAHRAAAALLLEHSVGGSAYLTFCVSQKTSKLYRFHKTNNIHCCYVTIILKASQIYLYNFISKAAIYYPLTETQTIHSETAVSKSTLLSSQP